MSEHYFITFLLLCDHVVSVKIYLWKGKLYIFGDSIEAPQLWYLAGKLSSIEAGGLFQNSNNHCKKLGKPFLQKKSPQIYQNFVFSISGWHISIKVKSCASNAIRTISISLAYHSFKNSAIFAKKAPRSAIFSFFQVLVHISLWKSCVAHLLVLERHPYLKPIFISKSQPFLLK